MKNGSRPIVVWARAIQISVGSSFDLNVEYHTSDLCHLI
jgi:hypothetical protein